MSASSKQDDNRDCPHSFGEKNRQPFHDKAVINYLVHQSSVLRKRVLAHVKIVPNRDSAMHALSQVPNSGTSLGNEEVKLSDTVIQGLESSRSVADSERGRKIVAAIHDICSSQAESKVYQDCCRYVNMSVYLPDFPDRKSVV